AEVCAREGATVGINYRRNPADAEALARSLRERHGAQSHLLAFDVGDAAAIACCRFVLPHMMANRAGAIVNLGSIASRFVAQGQAVYAATKGAIESLTRALALEYGRANVRVNCVLPGPI